MSLRLRVLAELQAVADPSRVAAQQAYMKSTMPRLGLSARDFYAACRRAFAGVTFPSAAAWQREVRTMWRKARYREEWYAAVELTGVRAALPYQTPDALPLYEEIIVGGAWWDIVDGVAKHRLGLLLREHHRPMRRAMLAWSRDDNMWKRRSAILCQLAFKADTDLELLYACIEPSLASKEFFLRKAIGWALRQYAWTDPREVRRYVRAHDAELSGLSKREALKNADR
jgi:3-methyladenine DNA glycosylase AlkD